MRHTDTSSFLQEKKSRRRGVRFSGGDQSRLGRRDPIQPLRNPINPPDYDFLFVRKIHRVFLFPSNPAPHRTANSPRAERRRHATPRSGTDLHREEPRPSAQAQSRRRRRRLRPPAPDFFSCLPPWIGIDWDYSGGGDRRRAARVARGPNLKT
jgi:hypothetical protein